MQLVRFDEQFGRITRTIMTTTRIIKIAINSQVPIVPLGFASNRNFKLKSWDSFLITYPFSKCKFVWGKPINIPPKTKDSEIERYKEILEDEINFCMTLAQTELDV